MSRFCSKGSVFGTKSTIHLFVFFLSVCVPLQSADFTRT